MTRLAFVLIALIAAAGAAQADAIKIVVPFAAGGPTDMIARLIGQDMQVRLKSDVVIENKGGAAGVIANEQVARSAPDGKTLLFATLGSQVISAMLRPNLSYDPLKSFTPVAFIGQAPSLIVVSADSPVKTFAEFVQKAK